MSTVKIEWSTDSWDCETCGRSWEEGAVVWVDDEIILNEPASAHCYDGSGADESEVIRVICEKLNLKFTPKDEEVDVLQCFYKLVESNGHKLHIDHIDNPDDSDFDSYYYEGNYDDWEYEE